MVKVSCRKGVKSCNEIFFLSVSTIFENGIFSYYFFFHCKEQKYLKNARKIMVIHAQFFFLSYFSCTGFIQLEIDKNLLYLLLPIKPELKVAFVEYFEMPKSWSVKSNQVQKWLNWACAEAEDGCGFELKMFLRKFC